MSNAVFSAHGLSQQGEPHSICYLATRFEKWRPCLVFITTVRFKTLTKVCFPGSLRASDGQTGE